MNDTLSHVSITTLTNQVYSYHQIPDCRLHIPREDYIWTSMNVKSGTSKCCIFMKNYCSTKASTQVNWSTIEIIFTSSIYWNTSVKTTSKCNCTWIYRKLEYLCTSYGTAKIFVIREYWRRINHLIINSDCSQLSNVLLKFDKNLML